MKGFGILAAAFVGAVTIGATSMSPASDGKAIFLEQKCNQCHSISALSITRTSEPKAGEKIPADLSGVGLKFKADFIQKWLTKDAEIEGKKHLKKFKGSDDELKTIATWLGTMKTKAK